MTCLNQTPRVPISRNLLSNFRPDRHFLLSPLRFSPPCRLRPSLLENALAFALLLRVCSDKAAYDDLAHQSAYKCVTFHFKKYYFLNNYKI